MHKHSAHAAARGLAAAVLSAAVAGCGGGGNPFGNAAQIDNPAIVGGQKLSFAYFQKCIAPVLLAPLQITQNGVVSTNTCAASGCHDNVSGAGGALRIVAGAQVLDLTDAANTPDAIRMSDIYKNFYSSQGATVIGAPAQSRLLTKPRLQGVLHGGGLIFDSDLDPNVKLIQYWINRPMPAGQDEFSTASASMFDAVTGACNSQ